MKKLTTQLACGLACFTFSYLVSIGTAAAQAPADPCQFLVAPRASSGVERNRVSARLDQLAGVTSESAGPPARLVLPARQIIPRPCINVLANVVVEPTSGDVIFVGRYDPSYATGAIDYASILRDALASPAPSFSLEQTDSSRSRAARFVSDFDRQMAANLNSAESTRRWLVGLIDRLMSNDPEFSSESDQFIARGAELLGVDGRQVPELVEAMLGRRAPETRAFRDFFVSFYRSQGAPLAATYIDATWRRQQDPNAWLASVQALGVEPIRQSLRARVASGQISSAQAQLMLEAAIWRAVWQELRIPEMRWGQAVRLAETRYDANGFSLERDAINAEILTDRLFIPWLNGLVLSDTFVRRVHGAPLIEVSPVFSGALTQNSELARIFLEADWTLKNLRERASLIRRWVPQHRSPEEFMFEAEANAGAIGANDYVRARMLLRPAHVALRTAPDGRVVEFGKVEIAVTAQLLERQGASVLTDTSTNNILQNYAEFLTDNFDGYARALPELHRLREAAKVLALVRWAQSSRVQLRPTGELTPMQPLPQTLNTGFWAAYFLSADERTFLGLSSVGGVDFETPPPSAWVNVTEEQGAHQELSRRLEASAILGARATDAAQRGELETARALAEQSAQVLTGDLAVEGLSIPIVALAPAQIEYQAELVARSTVAVNTVALSQDPQRRAEAQRQVTELQALYRVGVPDVDVATAFVPLLRSGDWSGLRRRIASNPPPLPGASYRRYGNGFVGGTTWVIGYNVPPGAPDAVRDRAREMVRQQARAVGRPFDQAIDFEHYNFAVGLAASTTLSLAEGIRVAFDQLTRGQFTAENQAAYNALRGKQFDELGCHSNGAMICLAALENRDAAADSVILYGPQLTYDSMAVWERLLLEGRIRSLRILLNDGDPVPGAALALTLTSVAESADASAPPRAQGAMFNNEITRALVQQEIPHAQVRVLSVDPAAIPSENEALRAMAAVCQAATTVRDMLECHDMALYTENRRRAGF